MTDGGGGGGGEGGGGVLGQHVDGELDGLLYPMLLLLLLQRFGIKDQVGPTFVGSNHNLRRKNLI